MSSIVLGIFSD